VPTPDRTNVIPLHPTDHPASRPQEKALVPPPRRELPVFLTPEELAAMLKLPSVETVYQWRRKHTGPPGFRAGRHVRYDLTAVLAWVAQQARQSA